MIGRLNHVAIAVKDIASASATYRDVLGAKVSSPTQQPDHGVTVVFIELPNTKIELLEPLGAASPIAKFLEKNPDGGMHHVCYEVDDILAARDQLEGEGRAGDRRRQSKGRRPRQAGAVPASQGFQRHAGRDRAGLKSFFDAWTCPKIPQIFGAVTRTGGKNDGFQFRALFVAHVPGGLFHRLVGVPVRSSCPSASVTMANRGRSSPRAPIPVRLWRRSC